MNLKEKVGAQLVESMKKGDKLRTETMRMLKAQILEFEKKDALNKMTENDELAILNIAVKKRKESIELFEKGNRLELAEKEKAELVILYEFMPKQLTEIEISEIVKNIIKTENAQCDKDFPKVIGKAMQQLKGKADGKIVNNIVKTLLAATS
ncbi:MAG: GatB/YqeY domain-containing protein [Bacteroidetes bacterium]|nr:GatB/YqeY domain-containing protein [Bacteroidota bacterium]